MKGNKERYSLDLTVRMELTRVNKDWFWRGNVAVIRPLLSTLNAAPQFEADRLFYLRMLIIGSYRRLTVKRLLEHSAKMLWEAGDIPLYFWRNSLEVCSSHLYASLAPFASKLINWSALCNIWPHIGALFSLEILSQLSQSKFRAIFQIWWIFHILPAKGIKINAFW